MADGAISEGEVAFSAASQEGGEVKTGSILSLTIVPFPVDSSCQMVTAFSFTMTWIPGFLLALTCSWLHHRSWIDERFL